MNAFQVEFEFCGEVSINDLGWRLCDGALEL